MNRYILLALLTIFALTIGGLKERPAMIDLFNLTPTAFAQSGLCEVPGYPDNIGAFDADSWGTSWCPTYVHFQVRSFAIQAAVHQCALAYSPDVSASQRSELQGRVNEVCARLSALGESACRCPSSYGR